MTSIDLSILREMLQDSLARGQNPRLTVTSNSMAPLFWANDQVILEASQPEQLHPGDIITIFDSSGLLSHRIWAIRDNCFTTRGDHVLYFDEPCSPEVVLGRVVGRVRNQHILTFQTGLGQWLDNYLAALARREQRWLTGSQEVPTGIEPICLNIRDKFVHRLVFAWAVLISFLVNLATRIKSGETNS